MTELRKLYPNGGKSIRRVTVKPWNGGRFVVSVTGSVVATVHDTRAEADTEAEKRIQTLERKGWIRRAA